MNQQTGRHRIGPITFLKWFGTGRITGMGTEICVPVRMNRARTP